MSRRSRSPRHIQAAPSPARQAYDSSQLGPTWLKVLLSIIAVVLLLLGGSAWVMVGQLGNEVASASNLNLTEGRTRNASTDGAADILLIGKDSRTDAQGNPLTEEELARMHAGVDDGVENTDTMMVVRVPDDGSRATAVSIPRDTYIHDPEFGNMKINGVYGAYKAQAREEMIAEAEAEGKELSENQLRRIENEATEAARRGLLDAIADLTGVDIDHYAEIGLHGFVMLTNAIGGVDVCLNNPVDDHLSGAHFPAGEQTLDGFQALAFVRQRHGLPRGDLDRIVRQQAFMASMVNKVLSSDVLTSPQRLTDLATAVERSVVIDEDWDLISFATQLADLAGGNVTFTTIPVTSIDGVGDYGESIVTVDKQQVQQFMDDVTRPTEEVEATEELPEPAGVPLPPELEGVEVYVLNASGATGLASAVGQWLSDQGVTVADINNAQPGIYYTSQVVAGSLDSPAAIALAEMLGGVPITVNESLSPTSVVAVAAEDYVGPLNAEALDVPENVYIDENQVGTPGADFGEVQEAEEIDAGGDGPRCIN